MNNLKPYISEAWTSKSFGYQESKNDLGQIELILEGEFQQAEKQNRNTRVYKYSLLKRETDKLIEYIESRGGHPMGMDHPIPDGTEASLIKMQRIDMENACGLTRKLEMQGNVVYGKAKVVLGDYSTGDKLAAFVRQGYKPGVSSRGIGGDPVYTTEGMVYVPEDYNMICYDFVTNPSTHNAILQRTFQEEFHMWEEAHKYKRNLWDVMINLKNKNLEV